MPGRLITPIVAAMLVFAGCAQEITLPTRVCPGKNSLDEALAALHAQSQKAVPLKANGTSRVRFYVEGRKKPKKEGLDIKLRVNPPAEIYLQGDKILMPKAVVLGSDEQEFWLSISPEEISTHIWGKWAEQDSAGRLLINPKTLLEALGMGQIDPEQNWSLSNEGAYDILSMQERGVTTKRIHIWCCDYTTRKIELFDLEGRAIASAVMDRYKEVSEGFSIPTLLEVATLPRDETGKPFTITIDLSSVQPHEKWPSLLFRRPSRTGSFKTVQRMINGELYEQPR